MFEKDFKKVFMLVSKGDDNAHISVFIYYFEQLGLASKEHAAELCTKFDVNKDGKINFDEFTALWKEDKKINVCLQTLLMFDSQYIYRKLFMKLDADDNGKITPDELMKLGERIGLKYPIEKYAEFLCVVNPLHQPVLDEALFVHLLKDRVE